MFFLCVREKENSRLSDDLSATKTDMERVTQELQATNKILEDQKPEMLRLQQWYTAHKDHDCYGNVDAMRTSLVKMAKIAGHTTDYQVGQPALEREVDSIVERLRGSCQFKAQLYGGMHDAMYKALQVNWRDNSSSVGTVVCTKCEARRMSRGSGPKKNKSTEAGKKKKTQEDDTEDSGPEQLIHVGGRYGFENWALVCGKQT